MLGKTILAAATAIAGLAAIPSAAAAGPDPYYDDSGRYEQGYDRGDYRDDQRDYRDDERGYRDDGRGYRDDRGYRDGHRRYRRGD
jgi:opacity protein-like surface antigen